MLTQKLKCPPNGWPLQSAYLAQARARTCLGLSSAIQDCSACDECSEPSTSKSLTHTHIIGSHVALCAPEAPFTKSGGEEMPVPCVCGVFTSLQRILMRKELPQP